jgi:uncharacterized membrane protein YgcG
VRVDASTATNLDLDLLDLVSGGMKYGPDDRESTNVEDRRPQSQGGPVPDDVWQAEQDQLAKEEDARQQGGDGSGGSDDGGGGDGGGGYDGGGGAGGE